MAQCLPATIATTSPCLPCENAACPTCGECALCPVCDHEDIFGENDNKEEEHQTTECQPWQRGCLNGKCDFAHGFHLTDSGKCGPVTIVTGLFEMKSKYPLDIYFQWAAHLLKFDTHMIVFTSPGLYSALKKLRPESLGYKTVWVNITLDQFWTNRLLPGAH